MTLHEPSLREIEAFARFCDRFPYFPDPDSVPEDAAFDGEITWAEVHMLRRISQRLALSREDVVPEGWVVAPCVPTEAMIAAALGALVWLSPATPEEKVVLRYRAMIFSAPTPEGSGG